MSEEYINVGTEGHCDYKEPELTQKIVDEEAAKLRVHWEEKVAESGLSQSMFIAKNEGGFATEFLALYQAAKEYVASLGLVMPVVVEGVEVNIDE